MFLGDVCQRVSMIKGICNAVIGLSIAAVLDHQFYSGRHTDAALAILRQIRHSFGL